jgi:hypothetical protein
MKKLRMEGMKRDNKVLETIICRDASGVPHPSRKSTFKEKKIQSAPKKD